MNGSTTEAMTETPGESLLVAHSTTNIAQAYRFFQIRKKERKMSVGEKRVPRVLDVGNCGHDHGQISSMLKRNFGAESVVADTAAETLERLAREHFDLVLINRKLDHDHSDGIDILKLLKSDPKLSQLPVMLVTNYAEYQEQAVAEGALPGFGKKELGSPVTQERLTAVFKSSDKPLSPSSQTS
jgi:CheY-like chemotaxis protein